MLVRCMYIEHGRSCVPFKRPSVKIGGGLGGQATNTTSLAQHATSLGSVSRANIKWGDTGYCVW